ncbi:MAG: hypothetical protein LBE36_11330 [Flavobacteriaceae bacterium]|jgi:hypothetical protein|nr:hypothetical protein [Flavobacteriaceae bacterium]
MNTEKMKNLTQMIDEWLESKEDLGQLEEIVNRQQEEEDYGQYSRMVMDNDSTMKLYDLEQEYDTQKNKVLGMNLITWEWILGALLLFFLWASYKPGIWMWILIGVLFLILIVIVLLINDFLELND